MRSFVPITTRRRILVVNGAALAITGVVQVIQDSVSHFSSAGVWGDIFRDSPYTIGVVEAHAFAAMTGVVLAAMAVRTAWPFWHGYAALVHLMLGAANLIFWGTFTEFDKVALGVVATALHGLFLVLETACFVSAWLDGPAVTSTSQSRELVSSSDRS